MVNICLDTHKKNIYIMTSLGTLVEKLSADELMFGLAEFEYRH